MGKHLFQEPKPISEAGKWPPLKRDNFCDLRQRKETLSSLDTGLRATPHISPLSFHFIHRNPLTIFKFCFASLSALKHSKCSGFTTSGLCFLSEEVIPMVSSGPRSSEIGGSGVPAILWRARPGLAPTSIFSHQEPWLFRGIYQGEASESPEGMLKPVLAL